MSTRIMYERKFYRLDKSLVSVLEYMTNITMVETEGVADEGKDMWVETYYISTSNSSESEAFINYTEDGQDKMVRIIVIHLFLP